jgi:hypothetical protein
MLKDKNKRNILYIIESKIKKSMSRILLSYLKLASKYGENIAKTYYYR